MRPPLASAGPAGQGTETDSSYCEPSIEVIST
jgi:hypothetical protein